VRIVIELELGNVYMNLSDSLEAYVCFILTVEFIYDYIWNTRENRIKRRKASAKKDKIVEPAPLLSSSGKKDVALVPQQSKGIEESKDFNWGMEMREVFQVRDKDRLHDEAGTEEKKD